MTNERKYYLTGKGIQDALKLLKGVAPSELGYNFREAVIILMLVEPYLESLLTKLRDLKQTYAEASRLVE